MRNPDDMTRRAWIAGLALLATFARAEPDLGSKTPYVPRQAAAGYEAAPAGFRPVAVQLVARHGSRGLTKPGPDEAALALWRQADAAGALTPAGQRFGLDLQRFIAAQRALGYGNLSALGAEEHRQLARRMVARLEPLFGPGPTVELLSSGVDRAVDSSRHFAAALQQAAPRARLPAAWGADRFLLYFHRLDARRDVADTPVRRATLQRSEAYQAWLRSPALAAQQRRIEADARLPGAANTLLTALYAASFVQGLPDAVQAARDLMDVRGAMAGLQVELGGAVAPFVPADAAAVFMELDDAEDFYRKGPATRESAPVTYDMATQLVDDMLSRLPEGRGAVLRFSHAEILAPLVSALGVAGLHQPVPEGEPYTRAGNPWRTEAVIPMAANVQWEVWEGPSGERLVRMLLQEAEADFKPACDGARWRPGSHFYRVAALVSCYRPAPGDPRRP